MAEVFEVIAGESDAPNRPGRAWFELDRLERNPPPRLRAWIHATATSRNGEGLQRGRW